MFTKKTEKNQTFLWEAAEVLTVTQLGPKAHQICQLLFTITHQSFIKFRGLAGNRARKKQTLVGKVPEPVK